jgi:hypothetical protein
MPHLLAAESGAERLTKVGQRMSALPGYFRRQLVPLSWTVSLLAVVSMQAHGTKRPIRDVRFHGEFRRITGHPSDVPEMARLTLSGLCGSGSTAFISIEQLAII